MTPASKRTGAAGRAAPAGRRAGAAGRAAAASAAPRFFATPPAWRAWLERHHASETALLVGMRRRASGLPSITWPESVDEALCFGWIDGLRKSLDATSYTIRFTPRKPASTWSTINIRRFTELEREGLVREAGRRAFAARRENRSGIYSYEQRPEELPEPHARMLRANRAAWGYFRAAPASYRRAAIWWVVSAKQEPTRLRRLATLVADSAAGRTIAPLTRRPSPHAKRAPHAAARPAARRAAKRP